MNKKLKESSTFDKFKIGVFLLISIFFFSTHIFISGIIKDKKISAIESYVKMLKSEERSRLLLKSGRYFQFAESLPHNYGYFVYKGNFNFIHMVLNSTDRYYINMSNVAHSMLPNYDIKYGNEKTLGLTMGNFEFAITDIFDGDKHSVNFKSIDCNYEEDGQWFIFNIGRMCIDKTYVIKG